MAQYDRTHDVAFAGMRYDSAPSTVDSKIHTDEDGTEIPFGVFVTADGDEGGLLPTGTSDYLLGPVLHAHNYAVAWTSQGETNGELGEDGLLPGAQLNVVVKGRMWVTTEDAATIGGVVYVRCVAGAGGTQLGAVRATAVGGETQALTGKARFITSQSVAGGLVAIEVDMTA